MRDMLRRAGRSPFFKTTPQRQAQMGTQTREDPPVSPAGLGEDPPGLGQLQFDASQLTYVTPWLT